MRRTYGWYRLIFWNRYVRSRMLMRAVYACASGRQKIYCTCLTLPVWCSSLHSKSGPFWPREKDPFGEEHRGVVHSASGSHTYILQDIVSCSGFVANTVV